LEILLLYVQSSSFSPLFLLTSVLWPHLSRYEQYQVYKIPLNVTNAYGFSPAFAPKHGGSLIPSSLGSREDGGVDLGIRLPISGAIGVAINGVPIYPSFDNADYVVWEVCEGDACSSHSGKGGDYHYHGDPYGAYCMYNQSDYGGPYEHPPIIGFAADGYVIYGRYTANTQVNTAPSACLEILAPRLFLASFTVYMRRIRF